MPVKVCMMVPDDRRSFGGRDGGPGMGGPGGGLAVAATMAVAEACMVL